MQTVTVIEYALWGSAPEREALDEGDGFREATGRLYAFVDMDLGRPIGAWRGPVFVSYETLLQVYGDPGAPGWYDRAAQSSVP